MDLLPSYPGWQNLHPLVIHFPIALLLVAPVLVVVGVLFASHQRTFFVAALVVMALGTAGAWLAVGTGEAAGERAEEMPRVAASPQVEQAIERHEELGETTRTVFTALTVAFVLLLFGPALLRRKPPRVARAALTVVFLALYAGGALVLVRTAHQGGLLVHEHGVHAALAGADDPADLGSRQAETGEDRD